MSLVEQIRAALQPYHKGRSGKSERYTAPWRPGADGETLAVDYTDEKWYDHKDNEGGHFPSLAKKLGIDVHQASGGVEDTLRVYKDLADYAAAQGVPVDVFEQAKAKMGKDSGRPAIGFLMRNPDGEAQYQYRYTDGKKPKWRGQRGFKRCWYGLTMETHVLCYFQKTPLVICNGVSSVIAGRHFGVPAVAIPGGENANIPDELMQQLREWIGDEQPPEIVIALDCDKKGRRVAAEMAENLKSAGYTARAVNLGLGDKGDLANFCKLHGESTMDELLKCAPLSSQPDDTLLPVQGLPQDKIVASGKTWIMMHARDRDCIPPVEWIIPGEIPNRGLTVIYGTSGVGKSFFIIDRALKIAQEQPVVYAALEGESGVPSRIDAWCKHHRKTEGNLFLCLGEVNFFDSSEVEAFITGAKLNTPRMVIIDTLARAMGEGDENSTRDMNKLMSLCKRLYTALDCAVILVHHTGKDGQQERGSYSLRGAADSMIQLVDDDEFIQVECTKTKDAKPFPTYFMKLLPVDVGVVDASGKRLETPVIVLGDPNRSDELNELTIKQRKVLQVMAMDIFEHGCSVAEIAETVNGLQRQAVNRIVSRLKKLQFVQQEAPRQPYRLTDKARLVLGIEPVETHETHETVVKKFPATGNGVNENPNTTVSTVSTVSSDSTVSTETLFNEREMAQAVDPANYGYGGEVQ